MADMSVSSGKQGKGALRKRHTKKRAKAGARQDNSASTDNQEQSDALGAIFDDGLPPASTTSGLQPTWPALNLSGKHI